MKNKKTVIVTGGLGFIGSNLIDLLLKKNFYVINIDKVSYSSNFYNIKDFKSKKNYKFIKCDILNKRKIIDIFIKEKPKVFTITSFSDSGVKLKFVGVTLPGKQWDVRTKLIREIKLAFDQAGIKIPYNQLRVIN